MKMLILYKDNLYHFLKYILNYDKILDQNLKSLDNLKVYL